MVEQVEVRIADLGIGARDGEAHPSRSLRVGARVVRVAQCDPVLHAEIGELPRALPVSIDVSVEDQAIDGVTLPADLREPFAIGETSQTGVDHREVINEIAPDNRSLGEAATRISPAIPMTISPRNHRVANHLRRDAVDCDGLGGDFDAGIDQAVATLRDLASIEPHEGKRDWQRCVGSGPVVSRSKPSAGPSAEITGHAGFRSFRPRCSRESSRPRGQVKRGPRAARQCPS